MSLSKTITVNANYTRSINLERDYESVSLVQSYIPTSRSAYALNKALATLEFVSDMPRAWTLVGPYGSGKSSFAVFLSHLLANPEYSASQAASDVLNNSHPDLANKFKEVSSRTSGHCIVLLTGSPEPLGKRLIFALKEATEKYWKSRRGVSPKEVRYIQTLSGQEKVKTSEIIKGIKGLQNAIARIGGNGLLIVIDELGKFLEYEARHPETNDIYLLQALAELAYVGGEAALSIYVILHQSFEQYAKGLGDSLKNEWAKVQGRFENIPFLEATEQTLRVVGNAIEHDKSANFEEVRKQASKIAHTLAKVKALPGTLNEKNASDLFTKCYPLHPVSALLLPVLCEKVAQNERTLFNYLGSEECFGFKKSLSGLNKIGDWIYPWEVYEYFIHNQSASLADHFTHRRWAEVVTAVDRLGDIDSNETRLLKAIGLLNIINIQGGFKASKEIAKLCLPNEELANEILESLQVDSFIQYRKYSGEYRVWQGSDFDIETAILKETQKLGLFSVAEYLNEQHETFPIVARRFSIEKGTLRYFETAFVDLDSYSSVSKKSDIPRIIIYLSQDQEDARKFKSDVINYYTDKDILVEFPQTEYLKNAISEVIALREIQRSYQVLHSDPIAQREFKDRYQAAIQIEEAKFSEITEHPEKSHWYWKGETFHVANKRSLQNKLSEILDEVYRATPKIQNELINKDKPSSQAAAARNKLLFAMVTNSKKKDLGITLFPPEKAIYRAVLKETGLHVEKDGYWSFVKPEKNKSISGVWKVMAKFLESSEKTPRPFSKLKAQLVLPPYGIKEGLLPILYLSLYLANQDEIALYENRKYLPSLSKEELERFVKNPHTFTVQLFKIEGLNADLFRHYSSALFPNKQPTTVIQAITPLARFIGDLNEYSKKTTDISPQAIALRRAFNLSMSPESLLFKGIPKALGFDKVDDDNLEGYADSLKMAIQELKYAYRSLLEKHKKLLANAFQLTQSSDLSELRTQLRGRYKGLGQYTVDTDGLKAFILRLTEKKEEDEEWFLNLLMFLGNKVTEKWEDTDQNRVEMRLSEYSRRMLDLETLRIEQEKTAKYQEDKDFDVILLKAIKRGSEEHTQAVAIDKTMHKTVLKIKENIKKELDAESKNLQLAVLAELVDEFLHDYQTTPKTASSKLKQDIKKVSNG